MKQYFALSLIFGLCIINISSLINFQEGNKSLYYQNSHSTEALRIENKVKTFARKKSYDSAIVYSKKLLVSSLEIPDSILVAKSNFRLGFYNLKLGNRKIAFEHYNNAFNNYSRMGDSIMSANMLRSMANIQKELGDLSGSIVTAVDALRFINDKTHFDETLSLNHIISVSYKEQNNFDEALKWSNKTIKVLNELSNISPIDVAIYKNSRANILAKQKKYSTSISILRGLLTDSVIARSKNESARIMANLGRIMWFENADNLESEQLLLKSLKLRLEINSVSGLISSNHHLANYYKKKDIKKAFDYSFEALNYAKKLNNPISILETLDLIIPIKSQLDLSLKEEANLYSKTKNELNQIQQKIRSIYATTKYDNDKLTNDNLILKAEKAQKERQNIIYLSAFALSILSIGFILYYKNQQSRQAKLEATYKTEIRLAKKIHDEVGNDIFYLMTQIKNHPELLKKDNGIIVLEGLDKVYQKARDISKEYTPINTDEAFGEELLALLNSYGNESIKIITKQLDKSFWNSLSKNKKIELFWIVRELMTNMRKYSKASFVGITFSKGRDQFELNYNDNGVGFTNTQNNWGNGLKHVETRIQNLKGNFKFDSEPSKGVTANIKFPI